MWRDKERKIKRREKERSKGKNTEKSKLDSTPVKKGLYHAGP